MKKEEEKSCEIAAAKDLYSGAVGPHHMTSMPIVVTIKEKIIPVYNITGFPYRYCIIKDFFRYYLL